MEISDVASLLIAVFFIGLMLGFFCGVNFVRWSK